MEPLDHAAVSLVCPVSWSGFPTMAFLVHIPSNGFKCPLLLIFPASHIPYLLDGNGSRWDETISCYSLTCISLKIGEIEWLPCLVGCLSSFEKCVSVPSPTVNRFLVFLF